MRTAGGLGNQLFSICAGYTVAKIKNLKLVIFEPKKTLANDDVNSSYSANWKDFDFSFMQDKLIGFENDNIKNTYLRLFHQLEGKICAKSGYESRVRRKINAMDLYWIGNNLVPTLTHHYETLEVADFATSLGFPKQLDLKSESKIFLSELSRLQRESPIAVHVRLGDFKTWQNGRHLLTSEYYIQAVNQLRALNLESPIWVYSDEIPLAKLILKDMPNLRFMDPGTGLTASEELILMSRSKGLVASRSSFSWWAAYWNAWPSYVVSPHKGWRKPQWIDLD